MLFDRYRLLAAVNHSRKWVPGFLETEIVDWVTPKAPNTATLQYIAIPVLSRSVLLVPQSLDSKG